jgi:hypothetical protein
LGNKINVFPGKKLTSDLCIFRSPHEEYFKMLYLLLMRIKIETCRMTEALDSGFVKLTPVFYSVNSPEAVTQAAFPPKAMLEALMAAEKSTAGDLFRPTAPVKLACCVNIALRTVIERTDSLII